MNTSINRQSEQTGMAQWSALRMRAIAIAAAIVVNVIVLIAGKVVNGEFPIATVGGDEQAIEAGQVIGVTVLVGLAAWGLLALLERTTPRAVTIWTVVAVVVFLLSLFGPLGSGVGAYSKIMLTCMHIGAAATIIPLMRRTAASRGQERA